MTARTALPAFLATLTAFVVLDVLWLMLVAIDMFQREVGPLLRPQPQLWAVGILYPVYAAALTALAVMPATGGPMSGALWRGALFGLAAYCTYDLTNLATLKGWSFGLALTDIAWGTVCSAIASAAGYLVATRGR